MISTTYFSNRGSWLSDVINLYNKQGIAVLTDVLDNPLIERLRTGVYQALQGIEKRVGKDSLRRAGEIGIARIPMLYHSSFFELLENQIILNLVDTLLSPTAILHLQNGFALPPEEKGTPKEVFQQSYHQDFPRYLNGYLASLNIFVTLDEFNETNGATWFVPGSHQTPNRPSDSKLKSEAIQPKVPKGSLVVFDSTLWHASGKNHSVHDRLAINHQFTRSFIKQQIDYPRALGAKLIEPLSPRTQQLLGWYTRVPSSYEEFYLPEEDRLYRRGQG